MAFRLTSTKEIAKTNGVKSLVYGMAGAGKTSLAKTFACPTVIISAEAGLLSLADSDIPVIEINTVDDIAACYQYLTTDEQGMQFKAIVLDSISELGEIKLADEKSKSKDARQAYGNTSEIMMQLLRAFRDLPGRHVLFIAKLEKVKDEMTGALMYSPGMPGSKLGQAIPYLTDEVFALRVERDQDGNLQRWLQTQPDSQWSAKDRSGKLPFFVQPNMAEIINIITGE